MQQRRQAAGVVSILCAVAVVLGGHLGNQREFSVSDVALTFVLGPLCVLCSLCAYSDKIRGMSTVVLLGGFWTIGYGLGMAL